ncbi:uncharacterized protein METZ01_LOCUS297498, partial [marine metagenome]
RRVVRQDQAGQRPRRVRAHGTDPPVRGRNRRRRCGAEVPDAVGVCHAVGLRQPHAGIARGPRRVHLIVPSSQRRPTAAHRGRRRAYRSTGSADRDGGHAVPWPEAMAGDRHGRAAGAQAVSGGRAGCRDERRGILQDRGTAPGAGGGPFTDRHRARHEVRATDRPQGHGAARGQGSDGGFHGGGAERPPRDRVLSGHCPGARGGRHCQL